MNKSAIPLLAALFAAVSAHALETQRRTLPVGRNEVFDIGFGATGYRQISGEGAVKVSMSPGSSSALLTAVQEGTSQIQFPSPTGDGVVLVVEVVSDLSRLKKDLDRQLEGFDDVEISVGPSKLLATGSISNQRDWALFNRVLKLERFAGKVESLVMFSVDKTALAQLREEYKEAGFDLVPPGARPGLGQLSLDSKFNVVQLDGTLYSQADKERAIGILKRQTWLEIVEKPSIDGSSSIQAVANVAVDDALLELGVAFVKISKEASKNLGAFSRDAYGNLVAGSALAINGVWSGFYDFVSGRHSHNGADTFRIKAGLDQTLTALAGNGVSRERQFGTLRFHANGDPGKALHLGGQMTLTPPPSAEGESPKPQDYEYGFKIVNVGSRRLGVDTAEADVEIEFNGAPVFKNDGGAMVVDQQKKSLHPTVKVPLGETVAVAGYESLMEATTQPTGTPILRHIPIVNWFVSGQGEKLEDFTLLFLVSVRKVELEDEKPMVPNTPMKDITLDANTDNQTRIDEEYERTKKYHGFWSWLNWFTW